MGKRNARIFAAVVAVLLAATLSCCSGGSGIDRNTVYEDMKASFEASGLLAAQIGIYSRTEEDGSVSYGNGGSGVIIGKEDGYYVALTSAHVVSTENAEILVFTVNTARKTEEIPGLNGMEVIAQETYDAMEKAEVLYKSGKNDLAVIRFASGEDLPVIGISENDPGIGGRILCVGNPDNEWFSVTYGKVTSGLKRFGESSGYPSSVLEHTAYMNTGSSGGAAIGEDMKLAGVTPGVVRGIDGNTVRRGVLIPASEIRIFLGEWKDR